MSAGLSSLSDADLMRMLNDGGGAPAAPPAASPSPARGAAAPRLDTQAGATPLAHLSNDDLMRQLNAAPAAGGQPSAPSVVADVAKTALPGLARGALGVLGTPADLMNLVDMGWQTGTSWLLEKAGALTPEQAAGIVQPIPGLEDTRTRGGLPTTETLKEMTDAGLKRAGLPEMYKPQTAAGEVANTLAEFAPNALFGAGTAAQRAFQVAVPALASEGAGQAARAVAPEYEGAARIVGALGGGVGTAIAQAPRGAAAAMREGLDGVSPEQFDAARALMERSRTMPGGGVPVSLDEALNTVTGGQATRASQLARVVSNSGGEGQRIASEFYAARPGAVEATGRAAFGQVAPEAASPYALEGAVQAAARAGVAETPEGVALAQARAAAGPRVTPEQAGQTIQPELRRAYDRREGMRAALAEQDYAAAREAPEGIGIPRTVTVERPGEPIVTRPGGRPQFAPDASAPLGPPPTVEAGAGAGPESLARFIARNGGIRLDGDAAATDLHRFNIPGLGNVARQDGRSIDNFWRNALIEQGYLRPDADGGAARDITNELLRKLQNEQRGFPSYPIGAEQRAAGARGRPGQVTDDYRNALSVQEERLDEGLRQVGVDPQSLHPDLRSRVLGAMMRGDASDPLDAYERTVAAMREPPRPYVRSTTVEEQIPDVRFGQVNPADVLGHVDEQLRSAKGPVAIALQQARKTLFEQDGRTLDLSVGGLHGAREAISDLIEKGAPQTQRALMGVRDRLDHALSTVPEYEQARSGFEAASRPLDPFRPGAAPGRIVAQDKPSGRFEMPPERVPGAIDEGPTNARAFAEVATPEARTAYEGHLVTSLLDKATDAATGNVSGKTLRAAMRANEDLLGQFPAARERLQNVAIANEGMAAIERSPLARMAQKPDLKRAIGVMFDRDPLAGGEAEIGAAMKSIARNDPTTARQLARIHLETVFNDAVRETRGLPAQYGGAGFASAVTGNTQQAKNLEAAIRALPNGDDLWTGLDRFLTTLKATGYRPQKGSDTAFNTRIQDELKGGGTVHGAVANIVAGATAGGTAAGAGGAAAGGLLGLKRSASEAWTRYQIGQSGEAVARMLFDPAALPNLRALAKSKPGTKNADLFTARLVSLAHTAMEHDTGSRRPQ